ncbi:MAG: hypothetical protein Q8R47_01195 [Nanoarchaeota archaeon]|nr:hypothetical protein [Nanoarchaeota archaeon]
MVKLFIKNKSGIMDDFTDLLSFVLILSMIGFFAFVVFHTDAGDKADQTLERLVSLHGQEELLDLINSPTLIGNKEATMKDAILLAVHKKDAELFRAVMETYFEEHQLEGGVAVFDSVSYGTEEEPEPLLSYNNVVFLGKEKGALYLTNTYAIGKEKSVVVKLFG